MTSKEYPPDQEYLVWAEKKLSQGKRVAWILITQKRGSAPRGPGTKMLLAEDGETFGTIGGGDFEREVLKRAMQAIEEGSPRTIKISLYRDSLYQDVVTTNQLCGGTVNVFVDVLRPLRRIIIVGAGHVARPLARIGKMLGYRIIVVDNFPEYANKDKIPEADEIYAGENIVELLDKASLTKNDNVIIVHGDGDLEADVLLYIYKLKELPQYIGLLSGKGKLAYILKKLLNNGIEADLIRDTLFSPAGIAIGSETPEEIAVAVIAEILRKERKASGIHERLVPEILDSVLRGEEPRNVRSTK